MRADNRVSPIDDAFEGRSKRRRRRQGMEVKVYLVLLPNNVAREGEPNRNIIAAKLRRSSAQEIVDKYPGAYIVRQVATK